MQEVDNDFKHNRKDSFVYITVVCVAQYMLLWNTRKELVYNPFESREE